MVWQCIPNFWCDMRNDLEVAMEFLRKGTIDKDEEDLRDCTCAYRGMIAAKKEG